MAFLDSEDKIGSHSQLLSQKACDALLGEIDRQPKTCSREEASEFVARLLRCYPDWKSRDPKGYVVALHQVFCAHPPMICQRIIDPVSGLPSTLKFTPKVADVAEALRLEARRLDIIRANAVSHNLERERRIQAQLADDEWKRSLPPIEERKRRIAAILHPCEDLTLHG